MKKKGYLIAIAILLVFGALVWFREPIAKAAGSAFGLTTGVVNNIGVAGVGDTVSTTTLNYLTPGTGTTSVTAFTGGTDQLEVNVFVVASSSALTDLRYRIEYSHSTTSVAADQLWFPEMETLNLNATTSVITQSSKEYVYRMASSTSHRIGTSTATMGIFDPDTVGLFSFKTKNIAARWTRVIFYIPTGSGQSVGPGTTALGLKPTATSTNAGIRVFLTGKDPL